MRPLLGHVIIEGLFNFFSAVAIERITKFGARSDPWIPTYLHRPPRFPLSPNCELFLLNAFRWNQRLDFRDIALLFFRCVSYPEQRYFAIGYRVDNGTNLEYHSSASPVVEYWPFTLALLPICAHRYFILLRLSGKEPLPCTYKGPW